jgi:hypothetical protein
MKILVAMIAAAILSGCGGDSGDSGKKAPIGDSPKNTPDESEKKLPYSLFLQTAEELPPCIGSMQGALAYVVAESGFRSCQNLSWNAVDLKIKDGTSCSVNDTGLITCGSLTYQVPTPADGPQGPKGDTGSPADFIFDSQGVYVGKLLQN